MLNDQMQDALNEQINMEMSAFYTYLSMSAYFEAQGLVGFAAWMRHHAEEEMEHAMKLYDFIHRRRGRVSLGALKAPQHTWNSPLEAFQDAFEHERNVSVAIDNLVKLAREHKDFATDSFLQWFVDEQVEEEEVVDAAIQKLEMVGDFGPGLYMLDKEMGEGAAHSHEEEAG